MDLSSLGIHHPSLAVHTRKTSSINYDCFHFMRSAPSGCRRRASWREQALLCVTRAVFARRKLVKKMEAGVRTRGNRKKERTNSSSSDALSRKRMATPIR